ncbi:hypothetical protein MMPV_009971, partial [Pyropia vietnamensis]
ERDPAKLVKVFRLLFRRRRPAAGAGRLPPPTVDASARVAAAAAELTRCRPRRAAVTPLETVYVSGVSRDARAHRLRAAVADLTGVDVRLVADVDRFGTTAAVTVVATAADALRAAVRSGPAASVLRLLPGADPWSAKLLGSRRREGLSAADAAGVAADFCRRRLTAKLEQLAVRPAMPPTCGALAAHGGGAPAPAVGATAAPGPPQLAAATTASSAVAAPAAVTPPGASEAPDLHPGRVPAAATRAAAATAFPSAPAATAAAAAGDAAAVAASAAAPAPGAAPVAATATRRRRRRRRAASRPAVTSVGSGAVAPAVPAPPALAAPRGPPNLPGRVEPRGAAVVPPAATPAGAGGGVAAEDGHGADGGGAAAPAAACRPPRGCRRCPAADGGAATPAATAGSVPAPSMASDDAMEGVEPVA